MVITQNVKQRLSYPVCPLLGKNLQQIERWVQRSMCTAMSQNHHLQQTKGENNLSDEKMNNPDTVYAYIGR